MGYTCRAKADLSLAGNLREQSFSLSFSTARTKRDAIVAAATMVADSKFSQSDFGQFEVFLTCDTNRSQRLEGPIAYVYRADLSHSKVQIEIVEDGQVVQAIERRVPGL